MLTVGCGRNDNVSRLYAPDHDGGEILDITSAQPFVHAVPCAGLAVRGVAVAGGSVAVTITNLTPACPYAVERSREMASGWSNAAAFTATALSTNWTETLATDRAFYRIRGHPQP
jgi:hypothetical protein